MIRFNDMILLCALKCAIFSTPRDNKLLQCPKNHIIIRIE